MARNELTTFFDFIQSRSHVAKRHLFLAISFVQVSIVAFMSHVSGNDSVSFAGNSKNSLKISLRSIYATTHRSCVFHYYENNMNLHIITINLVHTIIRFRECPIWIIIMLALSRFHFVLSPHDALSLYHNLHQTPLTLSISIVLLITRRWECSMFSWLS